MQVKKSITVAAAAGLMVLGGSGAASAADVNHGLSETTKATGDAVADAATSAVTTNDHKTTAVTPLSAVDSENHLANNVGQTTSGVAKTAADHAADSMAKANL
jgi:hypothetical protein